MVHAENKNRFLNPSVQYKLANMGPITEEQTSLTVTTCPVSITYSYILVDNVLSAAGIDLSVVDTQLLIPPYVRCPSLTVFSFRQSKLGCTTAPLHRCWAAVPAWSPPAVVLPSPRVPDVSVRPVVPAAGVCGSSGPGSASGPRRGRPALFTQARSGAAGCSRMGRRPAPNTGRSRRDRRARLTRREGTERTEAREVAETADRGLVGS